jgi:hypothetical protein
MILPEDGLKYESKYEAEIKVNENNNKSLISTCSILYYD